VLRSKLDPLSPARENFLFLVNSEESVSEGEKLLTTIRAEPHDENARLVYADWLEEKGQPDHATYLRLQVELVRQWWYDRPCLGIFGDMEKLAEHLDPTWLESVRRCTTPGPPVEVEGSLTRLQGRAKMAVRLNPRPGEAPLNASKIGGMFLWPKNEPWPICATHGNVPYVPALQLRREDVPELGFPANSDIFQLLWCPVSHNEDNMFCPRPSVFWRTRSAVGRQRKSPPDSSTVEYDYYPRPCLLYLERIKEYPDPFEVDLPELDYAIDETFPELDAAIRLIQMLDRPNSLHYPGTISDLYQTTLSATPGTKVGGYPGQSHQCRQAGLTAGD
jgi:uncharacterized protein (TIGR02996 family)